jgi:prepilin-type N-terminal cleavage/methylation domain-containing protein
VTQQRHDRRRVGFTLIELLIVMAIIAVLIALSVGASMRLLGASQTGATRTTLTRLETRLQTQMSVRADRAREAIIPDAVKQLATSNWDPANLNRGNFNHDLARVIFVKLRLKAEFPQSFDEALSPAPGYLLPVPAYVKFLTTQRGITGSSAATAPFESAICLYMALKFGPEAVSEEDVGTGGAVREFPLRVGTAEVMVPGYCDAWGEPLLFCRWPVGLPVGAPPAATRGVSFINPGGASTGFDDPMDPKNVLQATFPGSTVFANLVHPIYPRSGATSATRPKLLPVILSAGVDRQMGITDRRWLGTWTGEANDNIITERFR